MKGYVNLTHTNNSAIEEVSQKVDEMQDDYISKDTTELTNYYTKSQTYTKEEIDNKTTNVYRAKGSVQTYQDLPTTNNQVGDVYNVIEAYEDYPAGTNFVWTDTSTWDALGGEISVIQGVSQEDFDALVNNKTQIQARDDNSFKIGGASVANSSTVAIGKNADGGASLSVVIGRDTEVSGSQQVAIGYKAKTGFYAGSIAIGSNAQLGHSVSGIQLGSGTNNTTQTLQIKNDNIYNYNTHTLTVQNAEINGTPAYGVLSGTSAPTTTTVGAIGQFYLDTTNKKLYQCVSVQTQTVDEVDTSTYEWQVVGGGSGKYLHRINIVGINYRVYFEITTGDNNVYDKYNIVQAIKDYTNSTTNNILATGYISNNTTYGLVPVIGINYFSDAYINIYYIKNNLILASIDDTSHMVTGITTSYSTSSVPSSNITTLIDTVIEL